MPMGVAQSMRPTTPTVELTNTRAPLLTAALGRSCRAALTVDHASSKLSKKLLTPVCTTWGVAST